MGVRVHQLVWRGVLGGLLRNLTGGSWPDSKHNVTVVVGLYSMLTQLHHPAVAGILPHQVVHVQVHHAVFTLQRRQTKSCRSRQGSPCPIISFNIKISRHDKLDRNIPWVLFLVLGCKGKTVTVQLIT